MLLRIALLCAVCVQGFSPDDVIPEQQVAPVSFTQVQGGCPVSMSGVWSQAKKAYEKVVGEKKPREDLGVSGGGTGLGDLAKKFDAACDAEKSVADRQASRKARSNFKHAAENYYSLQGALGKAIKEEQARGLGNTQKLIGLLHLVCRLAEMVEVMNQFVLQNQLDISVTPTAAMHILEGLGVYRLPSNEVNKIVDAKTAEEKCQLGQLWEEAKLGYERRTKEKKPAADKGRKSVGLAQLLRKWDDACKQHQRLDSAYAQLFRQKLDEWFVSRGFIDGIIDSAKVVAAHGRSLKKFAAEGVTEPAYPTGFEPRNLDPDSSRETLAAQSQRNKFANLVELTQQALNVYTLMKLEEGDAPVRLPGLYQGALDYLSNLIPALKLIKPTAA